VINQWVQRLFWHPFELACRRLPLVPFEVTVDEPVPGVRRIRIDNWVTRAVSRAGGGYDYSVCYLVGQSLLIDTGFPWADRPLLRTLRQLVVLDHLTHVVNTHSHEDHVGNDDVLVRATGAHVLLQAAGVVRVRWPVAVRWYRRFMFGPINTARVTALPDMIDLQGHRFDVVPTPGHTSDHVCLHEAAEGWLFAGDLYVDELLDAQLSDVDGPQWISSLRRVLALRPRFLFDGHGLVVCGEEEVAAVLTAKLAFLEAVQARTLAEAPHAATLDQLTKRVFPARSVVNRLSFHEGRLSLLTGRDFARSHLVRTFLPGADGDSVA